MSSNYPTGYDSFTTHHDNAGERVTATDVNKIQDAVAAIQSAVGLNPGDNYALASRSGTRAVGQGEIVANVRDYGAVGDGTADDASAIQSAVDALPNGGTLYFPVGIYRVGVTITISKPTTVQGASRTGANGAWGSSVRSTSTSVGAFTCSADSVLFRDLAIVATAGNTTTATGITFSAGNYCGIDKCRITGWYIGVDVQNGYGWQFSNTYWVNQAKYGLMIRDMVAVDAGDQMMYGNQFDADMTTWLPDAAIRYQSGGGLKLIGNKITHHAVGIDLAIDDAAATSILIIVGNSFEAQTTACIRMGRNGTTGTFSRVVIEGNQFSGNNVSSGVITCAAGISEVLISGNIAWGINSTTHLLLTGGDNIAVTNNCLTVGAIGVFCQGPVTDFYAAGNNFRYIATPIINDSLTAYSTQNLVKYEYTRPLIVLTSPTTYVDVFQVWVTDRTGAEFELILYGRIDSGVTGVACVLRRLAVRLGEGQGVTLTTVGTDVQSGGPVDFAFDTSNTSFVTIQVRRNAADGGLSLSGVLQIRATGVERVVVL